MSEPQTRDADELARSNERLREQQDAISSVLRAVVRSAGLQPVLDEVSKSARRPCVADYSSLYLADGDLLLAVSGDGGADQWEYRGVAFARGSGCPSLRGRPDRCAAHGEGRACAVHG